MKTGKSAVGLAAALLGLFASQPASAQETLSVERLPSTSVTVSQAFAQPLGEKLQVTGKVSRWHPLHAPGHVDILIYGPTGALLGTAVEPFPGIMAQRRGRMEFPFGASFDFIPPAGSTVRVRYHGAPIGDSDDFRQTANKS